MKLIRVTWVDYTPKKDEGDRPTVRICGRSEDGERVVKYVRGCLPHCFIPAGEALSERSDDYSIVDIEQGFETFDGQPVQKVTVEHPKQINAIEDTASYTWESDIPFYRRATWDYNLSGYIRAPPESNIHVDDIETDIDSEEVDPIQPRTLIGDIEVLSEEKSFEEMQEQAEDPIVAITAYDTYSEETMLGVVDPEGDIDAGAVKSELEAHWGDHDLADEYVDNADITVLQAESEADLLNSFIGRIQRWRPDLLSGWNWIDFDHQYIIDRMQKLDDVTEHEMSDIGGVGGYSTERAIKGIPAFDQMAAYDDKVTRSENRSSSLEYVANEEIGIGKVENIDIEAAYNEDRSRLAAYNLLDVQLCAAITDKHAIEDFYLDLGDLTGIQVYDVFYEKRLVDGWIASRKSDNQILPNQYDRDIPEPAGGLVLSPSDGVTENVAVLDLKSLYPSSILSCNISPETMVDNPEEADVIIPGMPEKEDDVGGSIDPSDVNWVNWDDDLPWSQRPKGFSLDEQGIIAEAAEGPFHERERYKTLRDGYGPDDEYYIVYDRKQGAVKVVHNSMYGVLNSDYYRLAEPGIGDAITGVSRYVLWRAAERIREDGYEVIYGDTDSLLIRMSSYGEEDRSLKQYLLDAKGIANQLNAFMEEVAEDLGIPAEHPHVDASELPHELPDNANHLWAFEFEKFYESFLQAGKKKRYAGKLAWKEGKRVDDDAEPDVTGFESQRADVPKITAEVQIEVIKRVLRGDGFETVSEYIQTKIEEIREQADVAEIGIPKSLSKPLDEYPNMARVRAAEHSNEHLGTDFGAGDTLWMFYSSRTPVGVAGTDVFGVDWNDDIPEGYEVDEEKTIVKAFESALEPVIEEVGWSFEELRAGKRASSAEEELSYDGDPFASESSEGSDDDEDASDWSGAEAW